jgi:hypothetical protein
MIVTGAVYELKAMKRADPVLIKEVIDIKTA